MIDPASLAALASAAVTALLPLLEKAAPRALKNWVRPRPVRCLKSSRND